MESGGINISECEAGHAARGVKPSALMNNNPTSMQPSTRLNPLKRPLAVLLLALFVASCSFANFAYDYAPRIATRFVDEYLQLSNRQAEQALELFRERHAEHARDELPRYYRFLVNTETAGADGFDRQEIDMLFDGVQELFALGIGRTLPAAARILDDLDRNQLDALQKRLREDVEEDRERLKEDHVARRRQEALEDVEEWVGDLEPAQKELILGELEAMVETRPLWLQWRIARNEQLVALLREKPEREAIEKFLADYWIRRAGMPEELVQGMQSNRERYRDMVVALDASLSESQRSKARDKLVEYREMVLDMMPDEIRVAVLEGSVAQAQAQAR